MSGNRDENNRRNGLDNRGGVFSNRRVISYNLSEGERPDGIKVRYKLRIATGKRAREIDARQTEVIMEVLQWLSQHQPPARP